VNHSFTLKRKPSGCERQPADETKKRDIRKEDNLRNKNVIERREKRKISGKSQTERANTSALQRKREGETPPSAEAPRSHMGSGSISRRSVIILKENEEKEKTYFYLLQ